MSTVKQSMRLEILGRLWMPQCKAAMVRKIKLGTGPFETEITPDLDGAENYVYGSETGDFSSILDYTVELVTVEVTHTGPGEYTTRTRAETLRTWQSDENECDYLDCFPSDD